MKRFLFLAIAFSAALPLAAEGLSDLKFSVEGLRHNWYVVPTGADLGFTLGSWMLTVGGGYESFDLGRDSGTGDPLTSDDHPSDRHPFPNAIVKLRHTWALDEVDLWVGTGVVGYGNFGFGPAATGAFADLDGGTFGFLEGGATRDRREFNPHGLESGTFAQASAQWSPSALAVRGTDFYRMNLQTSVFFPLWDLEGPNQLFSGLAALRGNLAWTDGKAVPLPLLLPTEVRGYNQIYDARFLSVVTAELRVRLPSWRGVHDLVPVGFGFVDGGQYWGYADSATAGQRSGWLAGVGIGGGLEFFGLATPTLTLGLPLTGNGAGFWWTLDFNLRF